MLHIQLLRLTNGYSEMSDAKLVQKALNIHHSVSTHPQVFDNPYPTMPDLLATIRQYQAGIAAAGTGNRDAAAQKNQRKLEVISHLHNLGNYVLYVARGDRQVALLSGFAVAKEPTPVVLVKPENLQLVDGNQRGWIKVSVKRQRGAKSYLYQYTTDASLKEESWMTVSRSTAKCVLKGLQPGSTYYVRVSVVGAKQQQLTSNVHSRIAT